MLKIIGVRFKSVGKIYYFNPKDYDVKMGDKVIVETARGVECGEVALVDREIDETRFTNPVKGIIRLATPNDMKTIEKNRQKEKDAFKICEQKIAAHKLKMNLIDVECTFDNNKLLFYFTAESRVDFREFFADNTFSVVSIDYPAIVITQHGIYLAVIVRGQKLSLIHISEPTRRS